MNGCSVDFLSLETAQRKLWDVCTLSLFNTIVLTLKPKDGNISLNTNYFTTNYFSRNIQLMCISHKPQSSSHASSVTKSPTTPYPHSEPFKFSPTAAKKKAVCCANKDLQYTDTENMEQLKINGI